MTDPKRYAPPEEDTNRTLQVDETVLMRDGGFAPQPASAILDTGNSAMTVIDESFALRHAIYVPPSAGSHSVFAEAVEWTTLRGINAGAETRAPVVHASLALRGREFTLRCAVAPLPGHDVLVGLDVLRPLFADGYVLAGAR